VAELERGGLEAEVASRGDALVGRMLEKGRSLGVRRGERGKEKGKFLFRVFFCDVFFSLKKKKKTPPSSSSPR
jgi:hypothetical protein